LTVRRLRATSLPRVTFEIFAGGSLASRPEFDFAHDADAVEIGSTRGFPVQLDGEFVGDYQGLDVRVERGSLWVLA